MICERCSRDITKFVVCNYCNRKVGNECMKSSKRQSRVVRLVICKDCWSILSRRKAYKTTAGATTVDISAGAPEYRGPYRR